MKNNPELLRFPLHYRGIVIVTRPPEPKISEYEQQKVQEILLILEQLVQREDATVRFIVERLYDIGIRNVIHKKIDTQLFGRLLKPISRASRGTFRSLGTRWFQAKGPKLITDWLYSLVDLEPEESESQAIEPEVLPPSVELEQEMQQMRSQMRWMTTVMVGAIALLGSSFFWIDYNLKPAATQLLQQAASGELSVQQR